MQNLREQLLKAGHITSEQREKAEADLDRNRNRRRRGPERPRDDKKAGPAPAGMRGNEGHEKPKFTKKELMKQPLNRMLDTSDPKLLGILQAIEKHRLTDETRGDVPFHFTLRDGRIRKIFVSPSVSEGLEAGRFAIVESGGESKHVIVASDAVAPIRQIDPEAVRFVNV